MPRILVRLIAALWCGALWCTGALVAPALFGTLDPVSAGKVVAVIFPNLAAAGLAAAVLMLVLDRMGGGLPLGPAGRRAVLLMAVGVGVGYFGLKPLMDHGRELARAGAAVPVWADFGTLHGVSSAIYLLVALVGLRLVAVVR